MLDHGKPNDTGDYSHLYKCHSEGVKRPKNLRCERKIPLRERLFAPVGRSHRGALRESDTNWLWVITRNVMLLNDTLSAKPVLTVRLASRLSVSKGVPRSDIQIGFRKTCLHNGSGRQF